MPYVSKLPGLGINPGICAAVFYNNVLSNNASNIECNLFGIRQIDLTQPQKTFKPQLNKLGEQEIFKTLRVFAEPLVVQKIKGP